MCPNTINELKLKLKHNKTAIDRRKERRRDRLGERREGKTHTKNVSILQVCVTRNAQYAYVNIKLYSKYILSAV